MKLQSKTIFTQAIRLRAFEKLKTIKISIQKRFVYVNLQLQKNLFELQKMSKATLFLLFIVTTFISAGQQLTDQSYLSGRDYFVLRSGRAKMVIQYDKVNIGPAFSYMLFDARVPKQTARKATAFNYKTPNGFYSSAVEVKMKNYSFTALGQNTYTNWIIENGIPSVQAIWWASGIKVSEIISPVSLNGIFKRTITIESADLVTTDTVQIKLSVAEPAAIAQKHTLVQVKKEASIALTVKGNFPTHLSSNESIEIGPIALKPGEKKVIESYLLVEIPGISANELYEKASAIEKYIADDVNTTSQKWKNSNTITTSDEMVRNLFDRCRFVLPGYISDEGKMDAGIFEYGNQWVRDASNTALGVIHIGEFELARSVLQNILETMITDNGTTMISDQFANPDLEQFDQMGEFMHAMKSYVDWTGDTTLLSKYKKKITTMIERPLLPVFRDSTGMVHNRREFWERTFDDGYELAYQTWLIQGLRDAADLAKYIDAEGKSAHWRAEADKIQQSMLTNSNFKLIDNNHLIKRRNVNGNIVDTIKFKGWKPDAPAKVESLSRLMPDATMALPIAMQLIDSKSELASNTLNELEKLWNARWQFGGYDRYNTSSQGDQPGPWTFATTFIMRAQHEAGQFEMSRRSLEWLYNNAGGRTGAWLEEIPITKSQECCSGLLPWTTAEVSYFLVHHLLGIKFIGNQMTIKPMLYPGSSPLKANLRYRSGRINLEITGKKDVRHALINKMKIKPDKNGAILIPKDFVSGNIQIICND